MELDSDEEDSDTHGAGLISATGSRFASDPLRFTGIDLGESTARPRRNHAYIQAEDGYDSGDTEDDTEADENGYSQQLTMPDQEDVLFESAMRRIRRAQANGKRDVHLSKKELAALENRRKRIQEGEAKKKKKEQRYAVPLSAVAPLSHKENRSPRLPSVMPSTETLDRQRGQPPVGWFAHPSSSRPGTSEARRTPSKTSDREGSTSPFQYSYVQQPVPFSNSRHSSDPALQHRSVRGLAASYEDPRLAPYNPSASVQSVPSTLDPFRYMTGGAPAPYHHASATSLRNVSGSSMRDSYYEPSGRGGDRSRRQSRYFTPEEEDEDVSSSDEDEDETSDEVGAGARIGSSNGGQNTEAREQIIVEVEREPTPEPRVTRSKKAGSSSAAPSPKSSPKRKPVGSGKSRKKKSK